MPDVTPDNTFVVICDWHGRLVWSSTNEIQTQVGDFAWEHIGEGDIERVKETFARTATLREIQVIEIKNQNNVYYRAWLWPLNSPDVAVCILCVTIPIELAQLTSREKDCLRLLSQGLTTKVIAAELEIGLSTVHTHLKRIRKKLNLDTSEALISFAARFCHPKIGPADAPFVNL